MQLFNRRKTAPQDIPGPRADAVPFGFAPCADGGCFQHNAVRCTYTDRLGQRCPTNWCPHHIRMVDGRPYCRRHVNVVIALLASSFKDHLPDLENRAASLTNWIADDLNAEIHDLLEPLVDVVARETLVDEPLAFFYTPEDRRQRWERAWKISNVTGTRLIVSVDVAEANDSIARIRVNSRTLTEQMPPWVGRQNRQTLDAQQNPQADIDRRQQFYRGLLDLIIAAVNES